MLGVVPGCKLVIGDKIGLNGFEWRRSRGSGEIVIFVSMSFDVGAVVVSNVGSCVGSVAGLRGGLIVGSAVELIHNCLEFFCEISGWIPCCRVGSNVGSAVGS